MSLFCISLALLVVDSFSFKMHFKTSIFNMMRNNVELAMTSTVDSESFQLGIVLLAGGQGKRMKSAVPKQFLPLLGKPVFLHSLDLFLSMTDAKYIVIILDESYRDEYKLYTSDKRIRWADPGKERQDSVYNGVSALPDDCNLVAIHDSARPLVTMEEVRQVISDGKVHGAAVLGVPMKATVKESEDGSFVLRTVPRSRLWEVHTPQVVQKAILLEGFTKVRKEGLEVTDDVSIVESLGKPVKLTLGQYTNIKLTTPDDILIAEQVLKDRKLLNENKQKEEKNKIISTTQSTATKSMPCSSERYRNSLSPRKKEGE